MDITLLITLTILHWIAAYFVCRWDYKHGNTDHGLGVLWIPGIGWLFIWIMAFGALILWAGSERFKSWFYGGRASKSKAALRDVVQASDPYSIGAITNRVTNGLIINGLVTRSFLSHYRIWKKS